MSIDRGDRVIQVMFRSVCCCGNRAKVADATVDTVGSVPLKNVFVVCTQNVLARCLAGKLIGVLEDRHLIPVHSKLLRPTHELIDKSRLLKEERRRRLDDAWMMLVFRGREAPARASDCIRLFKTQYSLHKHDIYWTDTDQQAKFEQDIFFKDEEQVGFPEQVIAPDETKSEPQNGDVVGASVVSLKGEEVQVEEGESKVESDVSSTGPVLSVNSSRILTPPHEPEPESASTPHPTAEVISNTAVMLEAENSLTKIE